MVLIPRLRNKADIPLTFWDYRHHALVATIRTQEAHGAVARQAFHGEGIGIPAAQRSTPVFYRLVALAAGSRTYAAGKR